MSIWQPAVLQWVLLLFLPLLLLLLLLIIIIIFIIIAIITTTTINILLPLLALPISKRYQKRANTSAFPYIKPILSIPNHYWGFYKYWSTRPSTPADVRVLLRSAAAIRKSHLRSSGQRCVFKTQLRFQNASAISKRIYDLHFAGAISYRRPVWFQNADAAKLVRLENGMLWLQEPNWTQFEGVRLPQTYEI